MSKGYKTYLFEYFHEGSRWSFEIHATSEEDAMARLNKLPLAKYLGVLHATIPAVPGGGLLVRLWCWWKNLWERPATET
jgi:hypothetical protein